MTSSARPAQGSMDQHGCWAVPHADADDCFWTPSDPPYLGKRPVTERLTLMELLFRPREAWVRSGSMLGWGEEAVARCDAVVFLTLEPAERIRRLQARERVRQAGRAVDDHAWAERWLTDLDRPVLRLDSSAPPGALRDQVLAWEPASS